MKAYSLMQQYLPNKSHKQGLELFVFYRYSRL